jgi:hypothetical protein
MENLNFWLIWTIKWPRSPHLSGHKYSIINNNIEPSTLSHKYLGMVGRLLWQVLTITLYCRKFGNNTGEPEWSPGETELYF